MGFALQQKWVVNLLCVRSQGDIDRVGGTIKDQKRKRRNEVWKGGQDILWSFRRIKFAAYRPERSICVEAEGLQGQPVGRVRSERTTDTIPKN